MVEPASSTSVVLNNLRPETLYLVNVTAEYEDGFSVPITGEETTAEGMGGVLLCYFKTLQLIREQCYSMNKPPAFSSSFRCTVQLDIYLIHLSLPTSMCRICITRTL